MLIKTLPVGQLETNCYIVTDENTLCCAVIDPGDESNTILDYLEDNRLQCKAIFLTHGHFDHVGAAAAVAEETGASVYMHRGDDKGGRDAHFPFTLPANGQYIDEGDRVELPGLRFDVLATPGHSPGSISLVCGNALFSGDTLFRGSCGRVDLKGGCPDDELRSLKKLCLLPGDYEVYPGHMDATTLERERALNYYCRLALQS